MSKTVRVRIAVAVDVDGNWNACGWGTALGIEDEGVNVGNAVEGLPDKFRRSYVRFVEADVSIPEFSTIQGEVQT